jgi:glutamate-1-semialdehyde 2,1-aminomutase
MAASRLAHPAAADSPTGSAILDEFRAKTPTSATLAERARAVMPGGDTRTVAFHAPYPLTVERGSGCVFVDVDGNEYIDVLNNYTSLIHGHAHPAITAAVTAQLPKGTVYATAIAAQAQLAGMLCNRVASVDLVRFTNSGTEATMNAVRAARAFTGRDLVVKMEGGYHGTYDDFEVSVHPALTGAGPVDAPTPTIDARGVPRNTVDNILVTPFNNIPAIERIIAARGGEIAAVIVEPVMGSAGMIPAEPAFLQALRQLTEANGILLIFDEVMTFRLEAGGVQEHYGIRPDLTSFAKIIGGGFPVGAFGGRAEIMSMFDPSSPNPVWQSGTFNGNAITMVAGIAAMEHYGADEVSRINALGGLLRSGIDEALAARGIAGKVTGYGSFANIHFVDGPVRNYRDAAAGNQQLKRQLHLAMLLEGVFCAPRLMFSMSTAMNESVVEEVLNRLERALDRVASA